MDFYGKYYDSCGAGKCCFWYHFSVTIYKRLDALKPKLFGYWNMYYDGYFHFFSIWPVIVRWHKRPITKLEHEKQSFNK